LEFDEVPKILFGDEKRLTYILTCLLKNAFVRNRKVDILKEVKVTVSTSPEDEIFIQDSDSCEVIVEISNNNREKINLVITITDYGFELSSNQIKNQTSILKRIVKAMGGKLEVNSSESETNFIFMLLCQE